MTLFQTIILAIVQGISELFPISSVAHSVIIPYLFGWHLNPTFLKDNFLEFVVMMHLGTTIALLLYFRKDWIKIIHSIFNARDSRKSLMLIIWGTIPAVILGAIFEKTITNAFSNVFLAASFLIVNGILLFLGERLRKKGTKSMDDLTWWQAIIVGVFQSFALIPGFSRSGSSMTAGFWMGLSNEESAKYSMLLSTPVIAGAAVMEVPKLVAHHPAGLVGLSLTGGVVAGFFAFLSVYFLMHWFNRKEINTMGPFSLYCIIMGAGVVLSKIL
ncbi:undecaprenyl-diphosphate phosphatase [Ligilactobacillus sp. WILCCON 0076]|uniref:Undecaprenyl-diphosphatase n=1 Tax=Ligilactobacillus ubinensis TaxID=2876789 RepID=A0A9X2FGX2_9LACO|nr:undecaprenyl-diphosphate phosphatase [Ligilactobacillus ubinensis]MCP0886117.1 undecaprenyl-diphosphate phosphatase [Ligilactobacillus ubinensis]